MEPTATIKDIPIDLVLVPAQVAQVRVAKPEDEDDLMGMLRRMHRDNPQPFPMSEELVRETVQRAITPNRNSLDDCQSVCGIIGEDCIEASIGLVTTHMWFSDAPFLAKLWFWVVPEYRRHPHARALMQFSTKLADALQMQMRIANMVKEGEKSVADDRLWKRHLGGEWCGSSYLYQPLEVRDGAV